MRLLGFIFAACLALAVLQAAVQIAAIIGLLVFAWLVFTRPRETVGCILLLVMLGLAGRYPGLAALAVVGLLTLGILNHQ